MSSVKTNGLHCFGNVVRLFCLYVRCSEREDLLRKRLQRQIRSKKNQENASAKAITRNSQKDLHVYERVIRTSKARMVTKLEKRTLPIPSKYDFRAIAAP